MPVGSTSQRSVQVLGFEEVCPLTPLRRLIRFLFVRPAFCLGLPSDSQSPATPLPLANTSPCRVCRGLSPPSHQRGHHSQAGCACAQRAMPGAQTTKATRGWPLFGEASDKREAYLIAQPVSSDKALPMSASERTVLTPASSRAANFSSAVPLPPEMIAPAWPMRLPAGAVTPAM